MPKQGPGVSPTCVYIPRDLGYIYTVQPHPPHACTQVALWPLYNGYRYARRVRDDHAPLQRTVDIQTTSCRLSWVVLTSESSLIWSDLV